MNQLKSFIINLIYLFLFLLPSYYDLFFNFLILMDKLIYKGLIPFKNKINITIFLTILIKSDKIINKLTA